MQRIKSYKTFESQSDDQKEIVGLTTEQIEFLDKYAPEKWSLNSETGLVDIDGNFDCSDRSLIDFAGVRFGKVTGYFECSYNQLRSLEGAPQSVGGSFLCNNNKLGSLEGAPQSVGGDFLCRSNWLKSLEGAPQSVGGGFYCSNNGLKSLEGAPQSVGGDFWCYNNDLKSLEGAPQSVGGGFYCSDNGLSSLEGAPQSVGGGFVCDDFKLEYGQWNLQSWIRILEDEGGIYSDEAKDLIATLPQFYEQADLETRKIIKFQRMKNML
jgi:hypothetical protein